MQEQTDSHRITSIAALEALYGDAVPNAVRKEMDHLSPSYRRVVEAAPFMVMATNGPRGIDCSPRGDQPGFVHILDDRHLAIPDRRGNNRLDTLRNIVADPEVGLIFFVPGMNETVRVTGVAHITTDPALQARFTVDGKAPATIVIVAIKTVYFQCARALKRSRLWEAAAIVARDSLPSAGDMTRDALPDFDGKAYDAALQERQSRTLY